MKAIVDSGAIDTVCGPAHMDQEDIMETEASKRGMKYCAANGGHIKNMGEGDVKAKSMEGIPLEMKAQVGDKITKMLIAVRRACEAGNMVVFNVDREAIGKLLGKSKLTPT